MRSLRWTVFLIGAMLVALPARAETCLSCPSDCGACVDRCPDGTLLLDFVSRYEGEIPVSMKLALAARPELTATEQVKQASSAKLLDCAHTHPRGKELPQSFSR